MKKLSIFLGGLALSVLPCTSALAADMNFSFAGSVFSASGNFTYIPTATPGQFLGTGVTGTAVDRGVPVTITGVAPINGFAGNDNLFFTGAAAATGGRPFDFNGFAFTLSNGDAINLYSALAPGSTTNVIDFEILGVFANGLRLAADESSPITISSTPPAVTPEPASLALLGTGALGVFGLLRRKFGV